MLVKVSGGVVEPVSFEFAQEHLRLDDETDELTVNGYLKAARETYEYDTSHIVTDAQTWVGKYKYFKDISLSIWPVIAVQSVQYYDADDVLQTFDSENYYVEETRKSTIIKFKSAFSPSLSDREYPVLVNFTAGYSSSLDVPSIAKQCIILLAASWYENRQQDIVMPGVSAIELPNGYNTLAQKMKKWN